MKKTCKNDLHEFFDLSDFTLEEIARENLLFVAVTQGHEICKRCGIATTTPNEVRKELMFKKLEALRKEGYIIYA